MKTSLKTATILSTLAMLASGTADIASASQQAAPPSPAPTQAPVVKKVPDIKFEFPAGRTVGIQRSELQGDGIKAEATTFRLKWPKCYMQLAHTNSYDVAITILSGEINYFFGGISLTSPRLLC